MTTIARTLGRLLCVAGAVVLATGATAQAQSRETPPTHDRMAMMAKCQTMMAGMTTEQSKIDDLIAKMNAATGQSKIEQMAAVLTELVAQQKAMHGQMKRMHDAPGGPANPQKEKPEAGHEQHH